MSWFLLSLVGPFLYAVTNYIDKILLEKYFKEGGAGTILIISAFLSIIALPFLFFFDPTVFQASPIHIAVLAAVGTLNVLVLFFYLKALQSEEVSIAVIFYQLVPVFAYILGYFVLGEILTVHNLIAMAVIILGTSIVAFEVDIDSHFKLRRRTIFYMMAASLCWASGSVLFKAVALEENVVRSLFWEHFMLTLIGIGLFAFVRSYRTHFMAALRENSVAVLSLNLLNEGIYMAGNIVFAFAYLLAPISLVLLGDSYQPLFALLIGLFLTLFLPRLVVEKIQLRHVWQKVFAIIITGIGTYLLLTT